MKKSIVFILILASLGAFARQQSPLYAEEYGSKTYLASDTVPKWFSDNISGINDANRSLKSNGSGLGPYLAPLVLISYGSLSLQNKAVIRIDHSLNHEMMEGKEHFSSPIEDKLQYAPVAAVYALNVLGVKGKNDLIDRTAMYLIANSLTNFTVSYGKDHFQKLRPTGELRSFPSGHTATAFTAAEFMHQEYKDTYPILGYAGYSFAALTGVLRMTHNRHWLSDVVAGAGVGLLSTKISYLFYPWLKEQVFPKNSTRTLVPFYSNKAAGITLGASF